MRTPAGLSGPARGALPLTGDALSLPPRVLSTARSTRSDQAMALLRMIVGLETGPSDLEQAFGV